MKYELKSFTVNDNEKIVQKKQQKKKAIKMMMFFLFDLLLKLANEFQANVFVCLHRTDFPVHKS